MHLREEIAALGSRYCEPAANGEGRQNESEGEAADDAAQAEIARAHALIASGWQSLRRRAFRVAAASFALIRAFWTSRSGASA